MNFSQIVSVSLIFHTLIHQIFGGVVDNMIDVKQNHAIKEIRILYQLPHKENIPQVYSLIRGIPLFAEVDFIPRYIPEGTAYVAVSVIIPEFTCFGTQYILGYHQERWQMPACRLCTNTGQRYTMPLVLFLRPDSGCFDGRIPTYWKVAAIPYNRRLDDHTDLTIGLAYDIDKQFRICTTELTPECNNARSIFFSRSARQLLPPVVSPQQRSARNTSSPLLTGKSSAQLSTVRSSQRNSTQN